MIFGVGIDIVSVGRIAGLFSKYGEEFLERILSLREREVFAGLKNDNIRNNYLAKRFAAKEAFVKALGTGFRDDVVMGGISVLNNDLGKPWIEVSDEIEKYLPEGARIFVSIADEKEMAVAYCVIEEV